MTDDLRRAMEALEREVCASLESDDHGINDPSVITFAQAQVVLAALREREQAIEQARKGEREACAAECDERAAKLDKASADALDAHAKSEFAYAAAISRTDAAAIRARGER